MVTFVHSPACIHYSLSYTPSPRTARRTAHRLQSTASTGDNKAATGNTAAERRGTVRSAFDDAGKLMSTSWSPDSYVGRDIR